MSCAESHSAPKTKTSSNAFQAGVTQFSALLQGSRLKERAVQYALRDLQKLGLITPSDPKIVAANVQRKDRRPNGWDLTIHTPIHNPVHNTADEVHTRPDGVQTTTSRGAQNAPETSFNHPGNLPARQRVRPPARPAAVPEAPPPICGECHARTTDLVSARVILVNDRVQRCHPRAITEATGGDPR
jgi:hypothetical protein